MALSSDSIHHQHTSVLSTPTVRAAPSPKANSEHLATELEKRIEGEVRFDDGSRALYATDASNYRQIPIGVVIPRTVEDVIETVALCHEHSAPLLSRGGGTSLAGQCCNVAVIIDMSKYLNRVLDIDVTRKLARVQPGTILDDLQKAAKAHKLVFGPDPATHDHCTLGGMIGNNSCGVHALMAGRTADNVESLDVLTYDGLRLTVGPTSEHELQRIIREGGRRGEIYRGLKAIRDRYGDLIRERYPKIPRRVSGYNLDELLPENGFNVARALVGTESTCVTVLEATVQLIHDPPVRSLLVLGYPDVYQAGDHIPEILKANPIGLEGLDDRLIDYMKKKGMHPDDVAILPEGGGWLLVEFGGENKKESDAQARTLMDRLKRDPKSPSMKLFDDPNAEYKIWQVRESGLGATANVPGMKNTWPGWEDSAVPPDKIGHYLRDLRRLFEKYQYECSLYGHFGQGCVHVRIDFDLETQRGIEKYRAFIDDAADLVVSYGGSLSGEHGDGQARAALLPKMFGEELVTAFREFKSLWDPEWKMNPGKIVDPFEPDENLRLGTGYRPWTPQTHFTFSDDHGNFGHAALRCVGVGKCRRIEGGTMCPSFMVTREEKDSTRGRARLLFEMLQGEVIGTNGWQDEAVKDALDLCLACKGCKGDCPVNVDMATYKAEFLSHYYGGRIRPITAYSMGLIHWWSRAASVMPNIANLIAHAPILQDLVKLAAGIAPQREIPYFARQTFQHWFHRRNKRANESNRRVILWPDTFNNHFHPETAVAAVNVLEAAGFQVSVPRQSFCCGRPLFDWGMIDTAKSLLQQVLNDLSPSIQDGLPVVVLEPSCAAVFRDELTNLFPEDENAQRLRQQTFLLSEFLQCEAKTFELPKLETVALVQGHCHQRAVMKFTEEEAVLGRMGLQFESLDSGCCGMAGAFGFERGDHYDVSIKCGERVLLPRVREASPETLIIADGFSCREQISQQTNRHALHLAEVIELARTNGHPHTEDEFIEEHAKRSLSAKEFEPAPITRTALVLAAGAVLAGGAISYLLKRRKDPSE
jgi:FAD/FMN-containing dehydrogenase/Fe-S oxidoreductase